MSEDEIRIKRDRLLSELDASVANVRSTWRGKNTLYWIIKIGTVVLAAIVASQPVFEQHMPRLMWDVCGVLVLLFLLFDLAGPADGRAAHLRFVSASQVVATNVSLVDPSDPNALDQLRQLNDAREVLMERHELETVR